MCFAIKQMLVIAEGYSALPADAEQAGLRVALRAEGAFERVSNATGA